MNREEYNFKDYYPFLGTFLFSDWGTTCIVLQWKEEPNDRIHDVGYPLVMLPHF